METLATVIRLVRRTTMLPTELADALTCEERGETRDLRDAFERLSTRQKNCYLDWVGNAKHPGDRHARARLVASVVRTLSELATDERAA